MSARVYAFPGEYRHRFYLESFLAQANELVDTALSKERCVIGLLAEQYGHMEEATDPRERALFRLLEQYCDFAQHRSNYDFEIYVEKLRMPGGCAYPNDHYFCELDDIPF